MCGQAWLLMVINSMAKDVLKIARPMTRLKRALTKAYSQARLNRLWRPPTFHIGDLYASTMKTTALGLAYGPIYPAAYLWTAGAYLFCYLCTRLSITHWYRKPPAVDESLMASFCSGLTSLLGLHLLVAAFGCFAQGTGFADGVPVYVLGPALWILYSLSPLHRCFSAYRPYNDVDLEVLDTNDIPYDGVRTAKRYEMERYVCPKLSEDIVAASQQALKQFRRMMRLKEGQPKKKDGTENGDEDEEDDEDEAPKSCWERLASSFDDLMANIFE